MIRTNLTRELAADPDALFMTLVDPHLLPEWNRSIIRVLDSPARLEPGTEWVVEMSAMGRRWPSHSQAQLLDASARRFEYTSRTDDGNPSYTVWSRTVTGTERGSRISVLGAKPEDLLASCPAGQGQTASAREVRGSDISGSPQRRRLVDNGP